jgi:Signal transduction histidine kinase
MSYTLAIVTFLVGCALGLSVARRRLHAAATNGEGTIVTLRSNELLSLAFDALSSGVVIAEADATILYKNAAAKAISGVRHVDVLVEEAVVALIETSIDADAQHRRFDSSGSASRSFDLRTRHLSDGRILATVEDVTEQARVDTVRTDFVANLSHELKTPIGGTRSLG